MLVAAAYSSFFFRTKVTPKPHPTRGTWKFAQLHHSAFTLPNCALAVTRLTDLTALALGTEPWLRETPSPSPCSSPLTTGGTLPAFLATPIHELAFLDSGTLNPTLPRRLMLPSRSSSTRSAECAAELRLRIHRTGDGLTSSPLSSSSAGIRFLPRATFPPGSGASIGVCGTRLALGLALGVRRPAAGASSRVWVRSDVGGVRARPLRAKGDCCAC